MTGFDPQILQSAQNQAQTALEDYITTNLPNPTVGDVIGGRKTIIQQFPVLPSSLPNRIVTEGVRYDKLPTALQQTIAYSFNNDSYVTSLCAAGGTSPQDQVAGECRAFLHRVPSANYDPRESKNLTF